MSFSSKAPPGIERISYSRWTNRLSRRAERRGDFGKSAAHQDRGRHADHLIERPRQVRRIGEVGRLCGVGDGAFRADGEHGAGQLAPEHVAAERKADLLFEQMGETAGGEEGHPRGGAQGDA